MALEVSMHTRLLQLAEIFRQNAADTALPQYVELMSRAAEELEHFAAGIEVAHAGALPSK